MSILRRHRALHHFERLAVFIFGLLLPFAALALSTAPNTYNYHGSRLGGVAGVSPGAAPTYASFKVTRPGMPTTYVGKSFPTSFATLGKLGRGALSGLNKAVPFYNAYVLTKAVIDGAGWAIGELQGQVTEGGTPASEIPNGGDYYQCYDAGSMMFSTLATAMEICAQLFAERQGAIIHSKRVDFLEPYGSNALVMWVTWTSNQYSTEQQSNIYMAKRINNGPPVNTPAVPGRDITDDEFGQKIAAAGPDTVNALLTQDGHVIQTPELVQAMNELTAALEAAEGLPASQPVAVDPNFGEQPGAEQTPAEDEWPKFCNWAKPVCDFIDWVKEDTEPDPVQVPFDQETIHEAAWSSGLGGGSCPTPENVNISVGPINTSVPFSYETICSAMTYMRPVFLVMAAVLAAYIVGGFKGGGNA
jgi:hypothetical protein